MSKQIDTFWRSHLKLRHLRLLIALDEHRHVGRAAASLNVTQPAISKTLAEIEQGLNLRLFDRTPQGVRPTPYGERLIEYGRRLDVESFQAREELKALALGTSGNVSIGTLPAAATVLLPKALVAFHARSPQARVSVREGSFDALLPDLRARKIDFILGTLATRSSRDLVERSFSSQSLALVCRREHPLTQFAELGWEQLHGRTWVTPPIGAPMRPRLEEVFANHELPWPRSPLETTSLHLIRSFVSRTDALAFVPRNIAAAFVDEGLLARLPITLPPLMRPTGLVWLRDQPPSETASLLMDCLEAASIALD